MALANQPESHPCIAREDLLDIAQTYGAHQLLKYVEHEPIIRAYLEHEPYLCPHLTMDSERLHSAGIEHWFAKFSR
ncbi:hypothetical protein GQ42DRAFT_164797 [Ramicandelaber brevisporus]|nr:hypothetical protein GQ42DRAFT_164797 [Ramicandelaber brevisporus]